ncbi:MAG: hypothetical protein ACFE0O_13090 [Opitutales bacterium]
MTILCPRFRKPAAALALGLTLLAAPLSAQSAAATDPAAAGDPADDAPPNPVLAYLTVRPLQSVGQELVFATGSIDPTGKTAMMLPMALALFGYPQFPDLDPDANLGVFVLLDPTAGKPVIVGALKMQPGAEQTPAMLQQQGLTLKEAAGWTFVAREPAALDALSTLTRPEALIALTQDDPVADLGLTLLPDFVNAQRPAFEQMLRGMLDAQAARASMTEDGNPELAEKALPVVKSLAGLAFDTLGDLRSITLGVDLGEADLGLLLSARSVPETPLSGLFSQNISGSTAAGAYLPATGALRMVGNFDTEAQRTYLEWAIDRVKPSLPTATLARFDTFYALIEPLWATTGEWAVTADMEGLQSAQAQVSLGNYDKTALDAAFAGITTETIPSLLETLVKYAGDDGEEAKATLDLLKLSLEPEATEVAAVPVSRLTTRVTLPDTMKPGDEGMGDADVATDSSRGLGARKDLLKQDQYYTVVGGHYVQATSLERLKTPLMALANGEPVPESLADQFQAAPGVALQGTFDPIAYYLPTVEFILEQDDPDPEMAEVLEMMRGLDLPPLGFSGTVGDNRASVRLDLPFVTLRTLIRKGLEFQAAEAAREAADAEAEREAMEDETDPEAGETAEEPATESAP